MFREGQKIGFYKLVKILGKGGFGEVWLAERKSQFLTKNVAIKLPHNNQVDFETIKREAMLWEQASGHPNVLPIIDADVYDGQVVIVSEYAEDGSLEDKLRADGKFSIEYSIDIAIGILNGLEYLHNKKIIHRDIKPQNILLQGSTPRLADFGISHALQTHSSSRSANVKGTFCYMSPEAFDGDRNVRTDIWSVGVVLYQMLKGVLPFPQDDSTALLGAIIMQEPQPLPEFIPKKLQEIVFKALQKKPQYRFQNAQSMRDALLNYQHSTFSKVYNEREPNFVKTEELIAQKITGSFSQLDTILINNTEEKNTYRKKSKVNLFPSIFGILTIVFIGGFIAFSFWRIPFNAVQSNENQTIDKENNLNSNVLQPESKSTTTSLSSPSPSPTVVVDEPSQVSNQNSKILTSAPAKQSRTPRIERTRPKSLREKTVSLDDLIRNGKLRQSNN